MGDTHNPDPTAPCERRVGEGRTEDEGVRILRRSVARDVSRGVSSG